MILWTGSSLPLGFFQISFFWNSFLTCPLIFNIGIISFLFFICLFAQAFVIFLPIYLSILMRFLSVLMFLITKNSFSSLLEHLFLISFLGYLVSLRNISERYFGVSFPLSLYFLSIAFPVYLLWPLYFMWEPFLMSDNPCYLLWIKVGKWKTWLDAPSQEVESVSIDWTRPCVRKSPLLVSFSLSSWLEVRVPREDSTHLWPGKESSWHIPRSKQKEIRDLSTQQALWSHLSPCLLQCLWFTPDFPCSSDLQFCTPPPYKISLQTYQFFNHLRQIILAAVTNKFPNLNGLTKLVDFLFLQSLMSMIRLGRVGVQFPFFLWLHQVSQIALFSFCMLRKRELCM